MAESVNDGAGSDRDFGSKDNVWSYGDIRRDLCVSGKKHGFRGLHGNPFLHQPFSLALLKDRFGSGRIFGTYLQVEREGVLRVEDRLEAR